MNNEQLNYPITFSPMPVRKYLGRDPYWGGLKAEIGGYFAAPCYLLSEKKEYFKNGESKMSYEVVFIYTLDHIYEKQPKKSTPGEEFSVCTVDTISHSKSIIEDICNQKNNDLYDEKISSIPLKDAVKAGDDFEETITTCAEVLETYYQAFVDSTEQLETNNSGHGSLTYTKPTA